MKAIILAGGYGTRMAEKYPNTHKCMLPLNGKPALEYTIEKLKREGFDDIIIYMTKKSPKWIQLCQLYEEGKVGLFKDKEPCGTAGAIHNIATKVKLDEPFLVIYGDIITTINLFLAASQVDASWVRPVCSVVLHKNGFPDLGVYSKTADYVDKAEGLANGSIYFISPEMLPFFKDGEDIFKDIILKINRVEYIKYYGFHYDIGTPERYEYVNRIFTEANVREI